MSVTVVLLAVGFAAFALVTLVSLVALHNRIEVNTKAIQANDDAISDVNDNFEALNADTGLLAEAIATDVGTLQRKVDKLQQDVRGIARATAGAFQEVAKDVRALNERTQHPELTLIVFLPKEEAQVGFNPRVVPTTFDSDFPRLFPSGHEYEEG